MKIGVILSGCGVFDGAEIHESVFALLAIKEGGADYQCYAPDVDQHHVINHITGEEMAEKRNVLVEAARIARGEVNSLKDFNINEIDAMVIPGGFGVAKNLSKWAFSGPDGEINPEVKTAIMEMVIAGKPVCALCMGPTVVAKALEGSNIKSQLTVGTTAEKSPYDIAAINEGIEKTGATVLEKTIREIAVDTENKIVTAPCYMMEADIMEIRKNVKDAIEKTLSLI